MVICSLDGGTLIMQTDKVLTHPGQILSFLNTHIKLGCEFIAQLHAVVSSFLNKHFTCGEIALKLCSSRFCMHMYGRLQLFT